MTHILPFTVLISPDLPRAEREYLLLALNTSAKVEERPNRSFFGLEWVVLIAIIQDVGTVAGASVAVIKLAKEIKKLIEDMRDKGVEPKIKLQRSDQEDLELDKVSSDKEISEWLLSQSEIPPE